MKNGLDESWRERLRAAVDASGRSMRDISLGAGLSAGYLFSILKDGKDPTMRSLLLLTQELDTPVVSLFEAADKTRERQRLQSIASMLEPGQLVLLEGLARQMKEQSSPPSGKASESDTP
jgi:transcriptional regulator with XRE-family HTH domain